MDCRVTGKKISKFCRNSYRTTARAVVGSYDVSYLEQTAFGS